MVTAAASAFAPEPVSLATVSIRRNASSPASRLKTLGYTDNVLARREARDLGADEALMLNTSGAIACAAAANIFWVDGGRLFTPALDVGTLDGIVRGQVQEAAARQGIAAIEARETAGALDRADAVFITNSLAGVRAVRRLDGRTYQPHALVERLARSIEADA